MLQKLKSFYDFFLLSPLRFSRYETALLIFIAICFSIAIRFYYPSVISADPNSVFNGAPIINSSDGFWYAEGARDRIEQPENINSSSPTYKSVSVITSFIYHITPFSLEEVIFYLPAFLSSLLVIPLVLIGRSMGNTLMGFSVALLSVSVAGFYVRTIAGYYDDDFFTLTLPFLLLYFMIAVMNSRRDSSVASLPQNDTTLILGIVTIFFYHWWYQNGPIIITGLLATMFVVTLLFYRRNEKAWMFMILGFMANLKVAFLLKLLPVVLIYIAWRVVKAKRSDKLKWFYAVAFIVAGVLFVNSGLFVELVMKFDSYISKDFSAKASGGYNLHYFNSLQTVAESMMIEFDRFFLMSAWKEWIFLLGSFGYLLVALRYPFLWVAFPLYFIGLSAADAGIRFTSYGSPIVFLGLGYIVYLFSDIVSRIYRIKLIYPLVGFVALLYPLQYSYEFILNNKPPSAMTSFEAKALTAMKTIANRDDYIVSWWDFGYPVRYYADVLTHSDGGIQSGNVSYMESLALTSPFPSLAYNLIKDGIEIKEAGLGGDGTFGAIMKNTKSGETNSSLKMLERLTSPDYETFYKTRDIYWMMNFRMLPIMTTIMRFSNYDLQTGLKLNDGMFYFTPEGREAESKVDLGNGFVFDKSRGVITVNGSMGKVKAIYKTKTDAQNNLEISKMDVHPDGNLNLIHLEDTKGFVIVDDIMIGSNFVQMYIFENYNSEYFEPVMLNPLIKIYKLKDRDENSKAITIDDSNTTN